MKIFVYVFAGVTLLMTSCASVEKDIKKDFSKNYSCPEEDISISKLSEPVKKTVYNKELKASFSEDYEYEVGGCGVKRLYEHCLYEWFLPMPFRCKSMSF